MLETLSPLLKLLLCLCKINHDFQNFYIIKITLRYCIYYSKRKVTFACLLVEFILSRDGEPITSFASSSILSICNQNENKTTFGIQLDCICLFIQMVLGTLQLIVHCNNSGFHLILWNTENVMCLIVDPKSP